tara:strand:+ start:1545 stop:2054 length:510 start_codon:yes stop_codon:yes gene_type:complete
MKTIDIFTDGSTINNCRLSKKARGGIGIHSTQKKMSIAEPFYIYPITNQRCELYACIRAVQLVMEKAKSKVRIRILTDSKYVINSMTKWIKMWKLRGWKKANKQEPLNMDLIYWLDSLITQYKDKLEITFKHVKAHKEAPSKKSPDYYYWKGNFIADKLSKKGRRSSCD